VSYIETHPLPHNTIQIIHAEWDLIVKDPPYQRNGDVWSLEKKQLLIDSIINRYDLPKIYFHKYDRDNARKTGKQYAVIDGRQRLETIVKFIEGKFSLSDDFEYLEDQKVDAAGMNYSELGKSYPKIKSRFDAFSLPIVTVETDDLELIEDMFSRLNEAVPLNSAEKRRAIGGDVVKAVDEVSEHPFFSEKVKFSNKRYQHKEAAIRLLFIFHNLSDNKILDTKKPLLDTFAREYKTGNISQVRKFKKQVNDLLGEIAPIFQASDPLLIAQATVPVYALAFLALKKTGDTKKFSRSRLVKFNQSRIDNRDAAEKDIAKADYELLEYDRLSQQGTNDSNSIRERVNILVKHLMAR
jgi:hypothetical protein